MSRLKILPDAEESPTRVPMPCAACDVRELSICSVLHDRELDRMAALVSRVPIAPGQTIFQEGDDADSVYNLIEGSVRLFKLLPDGRRQITGFVFESDFLGIALKDRYAYSAEAIERTTVCRFPRLKLESLFEEMPKLEKRLLDQASNELIAAQDQMLLLGRKTAVERVASFLVTLARRRDVFEAGATLALPMTRTDIADYLGLTIETVSRSFTKLRKSGLVETPDAHSVVLADTEGLLGLTESG